MGIDVSAIKEEMRKPKSSAPSFSSRIKAAIAKGREGARAKFKEYSEQKKAERMAYKKAYSKERITQARKQGKEKAMNPKFGGPTRMGGGLGYRDNAPSMNLGVSLNTDEINGRSSGYGNEHGIGLNLPKGRKRGGFGGFI